MNPYRYLGIFVALLAVAPVFGRPKVGSNGIFNGASFAAQFFPNGGIAQGSWFTIFRDAPSECEDKGVVCDLGPASGALKQELPYETELGGVRVAISGGGRSVDAFLLYVSALQINGIMPSDAPLGTAQLTVTYNGETSDPVDVKIVKSTFGAFTPSQTGRGPGWVFNFNAPGDEPANTNQRTARGGQFATVWGTGVGPVTIPDNVAPLEAAGGDVNFLDLKEEANVKVYVGTVQSPQVFYAGRSPQFPALDQITFQVPANAPEGCWVPVTVETDGIPSPSFTMAIDGEGQPCSDPLNPFSEVITSGGNLGVMLLIRATGELTLVPGTQGSRFIWDLFAGSFVAQPGGNFAYNFFMSLPPVGACMSAAGNLDVLNLVLNKQLPDIELGLEIDGGEKITVTRQVNPQMVEIPRVLDRGYVKTTGGALLPEDDTPPPFWDPGVFRLASSGSGQVEAFNVDVTFPESVSWTNPDALATIDINARATFKWQGGNPGDVVVLAGANVDVNNAKATIFYCFSPREANEYSVPPQVLKTMIPTGGGGPRLGFAGVGVIPVNNIAEFQADGLTGGAALPAIVDLRVVTYE